MKTLLAEEAVSSAREALAHKDLTELGIQTSLSGIVLVPVSLPPDVQGLRADQQSGRLAIARVRLVGPNGRTMQEAEASLSWREARWLEGNPKSRRNRPPQEVLREAVHKVVRRAVAKL